MKENKKYFDPKLEVISFVAKDIITVSVDEDGANWGKGTEEEFEG